MNSNCIKTLTAIATADLIRFQPIQGQILNSMRLLIVLISDSGRPRRRLLNYRSIPQTAILLQLRLSK